MSYEKHDLGPGPRLMAPGRSTPRAQAPNGGARRSPERLGPRGPRSRWVPTSRVQWAILACLLVGVSVSNAAWLIVDQRPTDMDQGRYMMMVRDFAEGWRRPDGATMKSVLFGNHPSHPHLVPLLASVPFALFGRHPDAAYFVNTLFHLGLVILVFLTGRRLGGPASGLVAAFLAAGLPLLSWFSRFFLLEEAAAFFAVATLYCLLRAERFSSTGWSVLAGLTIGFGLLTKWTLVVFVAPPVLWLAAASVLDRRDPKPLARLAALGVASGLVAAPWYLSHWEPLQRFFAYNEEGLLFADDGPGISQLLYYLRAFWAAAGWPFTLLVLLGVAFVAFRRSAEHLAILLSAAVPLVVFSFLISTRDLRHLMPAFPAILLLAAVAVGSQRPSWLRNGLSVAAILLACLSAVHAAWGLAGWRSELTLGNRWSLILPAARAPDPRDWRFEELLGAAAADVRPAAAGNRPATVRVLSGNLPFRTNGFAFLSAERFPSLRLVHFPFFIPAGRPGHRHLGAGALLDGGYLLSREGDVNANRSGMFDYSRALRKYLDRALGSDESLFTVIHATTLPGGHTAEVIRVEPYRCGATLVRFLDWAHETDPDDPSLLRILSACDERRGEEDGIWRELAQAIRLSPADPARESTLRALAADRPELRWPRRLLAETLRAEGRFRPAAAAFAGIGRGSPYLCSPYLLAGDCWRRAGSATEARRAYETAVADAPDCVRAHRELAELMRQAGDEAAASREARKADLLRRQAELGSNVDSAHYRLLLGDLALDAGQGSEAEHHYRAALSNDPTSGAARRRIRELTGVAPEGRE